MYYIKLSLYYMLYCVRLFALTVFGCVAYVTSSVTEYVRDWELTKPTKPKDDDDDYYEDHLGIQQRITSATYTSKYSVMRYTYDIVDATNSIVESGLSSEAEAHTVIGILTEQGHNTTDYVVVEREHATVKGMGRDPDLHQWILCRAQYLQWTTLVMILLPCVHIGNGGWLPNQTVQKNLLFESNKSIV